MTTMNDPRAMEDAAIAADAAARERALDTGRSLLVQAPAGSGKTGLLTQRFLALLGGVEQPEEVAAITFTRKAAAEMRARVLEALHDAAAEGAGAESAAAEGGPPGGHVRTTRALARQALQRDRERGWEILASPARLRITTIDALCGALTRQAPWLSRFGGQPVTSQDARPLYELAAEKVLNGLEGDGPEGWAVERLLTHLDNNPARVRGLLVAMLGRRDHWLRHLPDGAEISPGGAAAAQLRAELEATLARIVAGGLERAAGLMSAELRQGLPPLAAFAAHTLEGRGSQSPIVACAGMNALPAPRAAFLPQWFGLVALLLTGAGQWRSQITVREGFPAPSSAADEREEELFSGQKAALGALLQQAAATTGLGEALLALRELPAPAFPDGQWALLEALLTLLPLAAARLREVFAAAGEVDFSEVALGALRALQSAPPGGDVGIRHLLVDEFQDTAFTQVQLLERLTSGWRPGDGRTLFLVGDPVQSIYGFREAEVGLFLKAREQGIGPLPLETLKLSLNFRSHAPVVAWLNSHFPRLLPREEDPVSGAVAYSPAIAARGAGEGDAAGVFFHPFAGRDDQGEAARVVELIGSALAAGAPGSLRTAILVRARSHLAAILPALKAANLSFRAVGIDPLEARPAVRDLLALTRALEHPADRVAWLAVLRAPWCGLTLADLLTVAGDSPGQTVWALMETDAGHAALAADGAQRLARVRRVMGEGLARRGRGPLRDRVEHAWLALGGPAALTGGDMEDARAYLDLLETLEAGRPPLEMETLQRKTGELLAPPNPELGEELTIMTLHGAKGLEFDTVILPGLGIRPRPEEPPLLRWAKLPAAQGSAAELLLAPIGGTGELKDPTYQFLARLGKTRSHHENGRLLYVALTRAVRAVHLLGHAGEAGDGELRPEAGSLLEHLWPAVAGNFDRLGAETDSAGDGDDPGRDAAAPPPAQPLRRLRAGWVLPEPPPRLPAQAGPAEAAPGEAIEFSWAGDTARHVGTAVHAALQELGRPAGGGEPREPKDLPARMAAALRRLGVPAAELDAAATRAIAAVRNTLADPRGRWLLQGHDDAENELALTAALEDGMAHVIIDRTFLDQQGLRWIVDYKTGGHEGAGREKFLDREQERYRPQLERYARILQKRDPDTPITVALYFPLLQAWRSWQPDPG
ncbi:MAG: UvrD-helicase domain-containing protein [bacterium]